ncbi:MAG: RNA polymerase sigma factor [Acidobacteria bacterium]|nr:RNA polymerase sigma factor [Acidobacteriota bacterium]
MVQSTEEAMEAAPERPESDGSLVARFQGGDESAFDELVVRHRQTVYRLAYRLMGSHEDADDLSQEAFMKAYRGLRGFRGEAAFRTWVTRIVVNLALNARQARRAAVPLEAAADLRSEATGTEATLRSQVKGAVGDLPPRQRQVLRLKVYGGLKFSEIARAAGMSVGTAKATFFQAVRNLRVRLAGPPARTGRARGSGHDRL